MSDYVSPKGWGKGDTTSNLYVFPAGTQTPTALLTGANIDNSGFEKDDQITMALFSTNNDATFGSVDVNEAGSRTQAESENSSQSSSDPSKATLLPVTAMENSDDVGQYLSLDGTCPTQVSLGTGTGTIPLLIGSPDITSFGVTAGSHTLGAITSPPGHGLIDCAGQTPASTTNANLQAGKRTEVFVFGDPTKPQLVTADVAS